LLPNLRHLNYNTLIGTSKASVASLFTLFSPNLLQYLDFSLGSDDSHELLTQLPNCYPQIEFLRVSLPHRPYLNIAEYISPLASLRHLKSLDFTLADSYFRSSSINPPNGFPSLVNLTVSCRSIIMVLHIFKAIQSTQLRDLELYFFDDVDIANIREFLAIIASRPAWRQSMRSISLGMNICSMTANDVRGLSIFYHLRRLDLHNTGLVLDDHLLDDMAKAWPMLEKLSITNSHLRIPSKATLNGLVPFSKHCPHIATLRLQLNATKVPAPDNSTDASRDESREGDRTVVLLCIQATSDISDPPSLMSFLLNLFPRNTLFFTNQCGGRVPFF